MIRINPTTYVPVLRWKGAEQTAISQTTNNIRRRMVPIIEPVLRDFMPLAGASDMSAFAKSLAETCGWGSERPLLLDPHLLGDDLASVVIPRFARAAQKYHITFGLVTGISRSESYQLSVQEVVDQIGCDVALRINPSEFRGVSFDDVIDRVASRLRVPNTVHLILDFQTLTHEGTNFVPWVNRISRLDSWPSITFLSGAFPKDLTSLARNETHTLPRADWQSWHYLLMQDPPRVPSFGDYTIQHGIFEEREGKHFNFSASIRYTTPDGWLVMRGEGVLNEDGPGYAQWPAHAQLLMERSEFCHAEYSWGDKFMNDMGSQVEKTGQAKDWLAAGINHHMTMVANQLLEVQVGLVRASQQTS